MTKNAMGDCEKDFSKNAENGISEKSGGFYKKNACDIKPQAFFSCCFGDQPVTVLCVLLLLSVTTSVAYHLPSSALTSVHLSVPA